MYLTIETHKTIVTYLQFLAYFIPAVNQLIKFGSIQSAMYTCYMTFIEYSPRLELIDYLKFWNNSILLCRQNIILSFISVFNDNIEHVTYMCSLLTH